jgi:hypothetical protein
MFDPYFAGFPVQWIGVTVPLEERDGSCRLTRICGGNPRSVNSRYSYERSTERPNGAVSQYRLGSDMHLLLSRVSEPETLTPVLQLSPPITN